MISLSPRCIPWTPFRRPLDRAVVLLCTSAAVYRQGDRPFDPEGDVGFRVIAAEGAREVVAGDGRYARDCVDVDVNAVFPIDRLHELAHAERRVGGVAEQHFSVGYAPLDRFAAETVPALAQAIAEVRCDCVVLTGGCRPSHRAIGALQRAVEMIGISTVMITVEPEETQAARVPRALCPRGYRPGCTLSTDRELQKRILLDALDLLIHPAEPGSIVEREYT